MIQIFADNALAYDSRLDKYDLEELFVTTGLNIGGTAELTMPQGHPAYDFFVSHRTIVTVFRDNVLRFRGRALYPTDGYYGSRTITCEGELCLFRDGVSRPYLYQDTPENIFKAVVQEYNSQVEPFKQFKMGVVSVTDPNDYVRLESQTPEQSLDTINKLLDRCGGFVIFTTDADGARVVNWLASAETNNNQTIEFGENLLSFASTGANNTPATGIIPYGAKKNDAGERLTIEEVNAGKDYLLAEDAQSIRGTIMVSQIWDDVYHADILLSKARAYLEERKTVITSLELSALDLSYLDKTLDSFTVGDMVQVISVPHGVNDSFQLTQLTEDLLNPARSKVTLGKEIRSLTGADVAGDRDSMKELEATKVQIQTDYSDFQQVAADLEKTLSSKIEQSEDDIRLEVSENYARKDAVNSVEADLTSLIQQTSDAIILEVSQEYATPEQMSEAISTRMTQLQDQILFEFETLRTAVDDNDAEARAQFAEIYNYISFEEGNIKLGGSDSPITLTVEKDLIVFKKNGVPFGWWDGVDFHTGNIVVEVNERAQLGDFAFVPRSDGSLSFLKIGG